MYCIDSVRRALGQGNAENLSLDQVPRSSLPSAATQISRPSVSLPIQPLQTRTVNLVKKDSKDFKELLPEAPGYSWCGHVALRPPEGSDDSLKLSKKLQKQILSFLDDVEIARRGLGGITVPKTRVDPAIQGLFVGQIAGIATNIAEILFIHAGKSAVEVNTMPAVRLSIAGAFGGGFALSPLIVASCYQLIQKGRLDRLFTKIRGDVIAGNLTPEVADFFIKVRVAQKTERSWKPSSNQFGVVVGTISGMIGLYTGTSYTLGAGAYGAAAKGLGQIALKLDRDSEKAAQEAREELRDQRPDIEKGDIADPSSAEEALRTIRHLASPEEYVVIDIKSHQPEPPIRRPSELPSPSQIELDSLSLGSSSGITSSKTTPTGPDLAASPEVSKDPPRDAPPEGLV